MSRRMNRKEAIAADLDVVRRKVSMLAEIARDYADKANFLKIEYDNSWGADIREPLTFKEYLRDIFAELYDGLDDGMPDAEVEWFGELDTDDVIEWAEAWGKTLTKGGSDE